MQAIQPLHKAIVHVDLDAFYAQVEMRQHPQLAGKPVGVVQYNPHGKLETRGPEENRIMNDSNGSLIAVSYEARASGVKRNMRGDQARAACPELSLVQVPTAHGKADLTLYRREGKKVLEVMCRLACLKAERASIDECYLDLTEEATARLEACGGMPSLPANTEQVHVMREAGFQAAPTWWQRPAEEWLPGERLLACAAVVVAELRAAVNAELGYTCSAGIAHTKLMAKLCSGLHKPAQQTVLPASAVPALLGPLPVPKLKGLGGKFGEQVMSALGIETVGQLASTPLARLEQCFGEKDALWLYALARGVVADDGVEERRLPKSVNCGKTFRGRQALRGLGSVHKWLLELGGELSERLEEDREENNRVPQLLTVSFSAELPWAVNAQGGVQAAPGYHSTSRSCPLRKLSAEAIAEDATALVRRWAAEQAGSWSLGSMFITAGNFVPVQSAAFAITRFFKPAAAAAGGADTLAEAQQQAQQQAQQRAQQQTQQQPQQQAQQQQQEQEQQHAQKQQQQEQQHAQQQAQQLVASAAAGDSGSQLPRLHALPAACPSGSADWQGAGPSGRSGGSVQGSGGQQPAQQPLAGQHAQQQPQAGKQPQAGPQARQQVDESVLAELPPELQREIRAQLKFDQMAAHLEQRKRQAQSAPGGSVTGRKRPASRADSAVGGGRGGSKLLASAAGTVRIDSFLKGKQPKQ